MLLDISNELRQMTTVSAQDIPMYFQLCVLYLLFRLFMMHVVLKSIGKAAKVKRMTKFINRGFDMIHYIVSSIVGCVALLQRPYGHCFYYAKDCKDFLWQNPNGFELTVLEKIYYMLFFIYYSTDLFFVYTSSEPILLTFHHLVTLSEVANCVVLKSPVVGLSIMLLHDITDMPLYIGKVLIYLGSKHLKDVTLVIFAVACTYFRIINYPMIVYNVFIVGKNTEIYPALYHFEEKFLLVLYLMHIFWEYKIFQNIVGVLKGQKIHDNRSD